MSATPHTSVTLLKALAENPQSARWKDLYTLYAPSMRTFLQVRYPSLEADDIVQEAMLALMTALPHYVYTPDEKGHFHNYLMGIVKHKAMDALARRTRENAAREGLAEERLADAGDQARRPPCAADETWQHDALEVALAQLLADTDVNPLYRTVFARLVQLHEKPEDVARALGTSRGNVDVIKKRMIERLKAIVDRLVTP